MAVPIDVLMSKWRRLDKTMDQVRAVSLSLSISAMRDAIFYVLNDLYALWEVWAEDRKLTSKSEDLAVAGDSDGETVAALICARGGNFHVQFKEFGEYLGFGRQPFGSSPFGRGGWYWQGFVDPEKRFATRSGWYASRVEGREVLEPLEAAYRWLAAQPEIPHP